MTRNQIVQRLQEESNALGSSLDLRLLTTGRTYFAPLELSAELELLLQACERLLETGHPRVLVQLIEALPPLRVAALALLAAGLNPRHQARPQLPATLHCQGRLLDTAVDVHLSWSVNGGGVVLVVPGTGAVESLGGISGQGQDLLTALREACPEAWEYWKGGP